MFMTTPGEPNKYDALMQDFVAVPYGVTARDYLDVRQLEASQALLDKWGDAINTSRYDIGVREKATGRMAGVGRIIGDQIHSVIVDINVHPDFRGRKIGSFLLDDLVEYTRMTKTDYVELSYNPKTPWLKGFYERHGFVSIDFGMWLSDSIAKLK
jgi:ribosomal protein S18 acetylase RimI-like enzyme